MITASFAVAALVAMTAPATGDNSGLSGDRSTVRAWDAVGSEQQTDSDAVKRYWTKSRMNKARPVPLLNGERRMPSFVAPRAVQPKGEPRMIRSTSPNRQLNSHTSLLAPGMCEGPIACTTGEIVDTTTPPNITHGKVFFRDPASGNNFVCSGTVVNAANDSVVWTAGHCVHPGSGAGAPFFTKWIFVPGFRNGNRPSEWVAELLITTAGWRNNSNASVDVAAAVMEPEGTTTIEDMTGARGIAFNLPANQDVKAIGYPVAPNPPFNGQKMHFCDSSMERRDSRMDDPRPVGIGCDMEGGSSGGGWVLDNGQVNSNVSYGYPSNSALEDVMFGPYFGTGAENVFDAATSSDGEDVIPPRITRVRDKPDPFTPNGDRRKDKTRISFSVNEAARVVVAIKKKGRTVIKSPIVKTGPGSLTLKWNGGNNHGKKVKSGRYTYVIKAKDDAGNSARKSGKTTVRR